MNIKDCVAERFCEICKKKNISINEMSLNSGVTPSTAYSMLDKKRRDISIKTIKKFCDGLNISIKEFFDSELFNSIDEDNE